MEYQRRHAVYQVPHYGLRKLSVGVASVLLSTTFFLGQAHADDVSSNNVGIESTPEVTSTPLDDGASEDQSAGSVGVRQNVDAVPSSQTNLVSTSPVSAAQSIASQSTSAQSVNVLSNSSNSVVSTVNSNTVNVLVSASSSVSEPPVQASSVSSVSNLYVGSDAGSQSTSSLVQPSVQYPVTKISVSPNINLSDPRVDASEFRLGFRDVATHQLVGLNDVVGKLGTSLQDVDFKLPDYYEAVNIDWQKNLPELSTGKLILDVGQTGSASLAQARARLLQEQQQAQLAALFGNSFVVSSGIGATSVANRSYGIDVSDYQGSNMAAYARNGAKFAIIKICEGMSPSGGTTSWTKAANAKAAGMMVMGYQFYHYAGSVQGAINQANYAIQRAHEAGIPVHSYLAIDWESEYGPNHGSYAEDTAEAIAWMQTVRNAGYLPMFYSGSSYAQSYFNLNQILQRFPGSLWIASYPYSTYNKASYSAPMAYFPSMNGVAIWQFTNDMYGMHTDGNINVLPLQFLQVQPSVPKQATVHVRFIDDDEGGKVVGTPNRTYNVNTTFKYSDFGLPTEYHWVNGQSGNTTAHLGTGDLTLDIHLRHNTDNRSDSKTVTRHWEIDMPDGQIKYGDQHATFSRNGWYDRVTKQMHWNNWSPAQQLPAVNVPASIGYTASGSIPAVTVDASSQNSSVKVTYTQNAPTYSTVSDRKVVTRSWSITLPSGVVNKGTQSVTLTRTGRKNNQSGAISWGQWSTGHFDVVNVPSEAGFTASGTIPTMQVTGDTQNSTVAITYQKDEYSVVTRPTVDPLAQKLVNAVKPMIGWFTYGQDRPITTAKAGIKPDDIKSVNDLNRNGRLDCSGLVWLGMKLAGEKVVKASTGPWYTGSMASDARSVQDYLKEIKDPSQLQPGDVIIVDAFGGDSGNNGHTAIIDGYGVDYGLTNHSTMDAVLASNLPILEMGGAQNSLNRSTIKNAFSRLASAKDKVVTLSAPAALAVATPSITTYTVELEDLDNSNQIVKSWTTHTLPDKYQSFVPANYTFAGFSLNNDKLVLRLRHQTQAVTDNKTVVRHLVIKMPNGQNQTADQKVIFGRAGVKDLVTGQTAWKPWNPATAQFDSVEVPVVGGYTASGKINSMTITPGSQDITVTITYTKNKTPMNSGQPSKPVQDQFVVNVIDVDSNNQQIKHETIKSLPSSYDTYVPTNYRLAGYKLDGHTLTIKVGHQVQAVTSNKTVTRHIVIMMPNGQKQTVQQSVTFGRAGVKDLFTGQTTWKNWDPASYQFDSVEVPAVSGYTASGKINSMTITPDSQDSIVTITYKKNSGTVTSGGDGHSSKPTQDSFIINVIDVDNNNHQIKHETVKSLPSSYNSYIPTNYRLAGYNLDGQTLTIKVGHQVQAVTDNKTVIRQIVIVMPNGQKQTGQQSVTFGRAGVKDLVTGQTNWKNWDPSSYQFDSIQVPVIAGFEASGTIDAMTVTPDNTNSTMTISYRRIGSHSNHAGSSVTSSTTSSATSSVTSSSTSSAVMSSSVGDVDSSTVTSGVTSSGTVSSTVVTSSSAINSSTISQSNSLSSQTSSAVVLSSGQGSIQAVSSVMNSQTVMPNGSSIFNSQVVNSISSLVSSGVVASHGQVSGFNSFNSSVSQSSSNSSFVLNQLGLTRNISMNSMIGLDGLDRRLSLDQQDNSMSNLSNQIDNSEATDELGTVAMNETNSRFSKGFTELSDTESIGGFLNQSAVNNLSPSVVQIDRHSDGLGDQLSGGSNDNDILPQTGHTQDVSAVMIGASLLLGAVTVGATMKKKKGE